MVLTHYDGNRPRKSDVSIAKNYLRLEEIEALNRIVNAYLQFAELQARSRRPMHMADWISKLDDFYICWIARYYHAGKVSHGDAKEKAESELEEYRRQQAAMPEPVD